MSLLPALIAMLAVTLAAAAAAFIVRDGGLATARHIDRQLAHQRAETALGRAAVVFGVPLDGVTAVTEIDGPVLAAGAVTVELVASADRGEIADLPLQLMRVTATGESGRSLVRLQADYAVDGCEAAHDDPCTPRVRRIALRELPVE
jgi:hypothetical protein